MPTTNNSILSTIKKLLGATDEYKAYDADIITYINSVILTLSQLGLDINNDFFVTDEKDSWSDLLKKDNINNVANTKILNSVKSYVYLKVKLLFDPPTSSYVLESINRLIDELEFRINLEIENSTNLK